MDDSPEGQQPEQPAQNIFTELNPKQKELFAFLAGGDPGSYTLAGYGGSAGGGKTYAAVRAAFNMAIAFPGNRGLIGRYEFNKLKETTMDAFRRLVPAEFCHWNDQDNWVDIQLPGWRPSVKSRIWFKGLADWEGLGSTEYGFVIIDEANQVPTKAATMLFTRLRWKLPPEVERDLSHFCRACRTEKGIRGYSSVGECRFHGKEFMGDGLKYFFLACSNPWPGWFTDWFWNNELGDLSDMPSMRLKFVQAFMADNDYLPENYEEMNRRALQGDPEMYARLIEGRFDYFVGRVYQEFDPNVHKWIHAEIPPYTRVIGGLDFGGESVTSHYTTGIVSVVTKGGRMIRVAEFKERGPRVYERQAEWMVEQEQKWAKPIKKRIEWCGDRSQMVGISQMRKHFHIIASEGGVDSVDEGIKAVARRFAKDINGIPGSFYLPELTKFEEEAKKYRRDPETYKVVKKDDDLMDSDRYMEELMGRAVGDPAKLYGSSLPTVG